MKVYLYITYFDDKTCSIDTFDSFQKAENALKMYTDVNLKSNNTAVIYKEYDTQFVPQEIYNIFWPTGKVIKGNTVREKGIDGYQYTNRFIIETYLE